MKKPIALTAALACIVAAESALALDDPPVEPTYDRPTFQPPTPPPPPPRVPGDPDPKSRKLPRSWDLVCTFKRGDWQGKYNPLQLTTMFSKRVDPLLYPDGATFCRELAPLRDMALRCESKNGEVHVTYSIAVSAEEIRNAKSFCHKVLSAL